MLIEKQLQLAERTNNSTANPSRYAGDLYLGFCQEASSKGV
jgi:hypothetical protein